MVQKYQPLNLAEQLQAFRSQKFTGLVCLQPEQPLGVEGVTTCFVSFLLGEINYAGEVSPTIEAIAELLGEQLTHPFFKMSFKIAREQCHGSDSAREVLAKVVATKLVTWDKIESVMQSQAEATLKLIAQVPGELTLEASESSDLGFGDDSHSLDWSSLQRLLENPTSEAEQPTPPQPEAEIDAMEPSSVEPVAPGRNPKLPTILSVDDSPIVQKMIQRTLSPICNVLLAENALVGLKVLNQETDIALILLDVNMPGISGLEFCRTIRGIPKFKNLPVIMLTANEGNVNKAMGQIAGSTLYLTKPVNNQKLIDVVQQYAPAQGAGMSQSAADAPASLTAV